MNKSTYILAIDGCDGTGKTSLINAIINRYENRAVLLQKSSHMGFMPSDFKQKINWFRSENAFVTGRIYLMSHLARFSLINYYYQRGHWKAVKLHRNDGPLLILIDRGILSLKCYTAASIMIKCSLSSELIWDWVNLQYDVLKHDIIEPNWNILLQPPNITKDVIDSLLKRTNSRLENQKIERNLIYKQLHLFESAPKLKNTSIINPFQTQKEIQEHLFSKLDDFFPKNQVSLKNTLYLDNVFSKIQAQDTQGNIWLCRGIVEKGYTNNDIDVICELKNDGFLLESIFGKNCHIIESKPKDEKWKIQIKR